MKRTITIDVDDRAPEEELCGETCIGLGKGGICRMFNMQLEDSSYNKISGDDTKTVMYEDTKVIQAWKRCKQCIFVFYSLADH